MSLHSALHPLNSKPGLLDGARPSSRVSVIVPTRDRPQLLQRTLAHIQAQTFHAFEVIVVDDGSSAETRALYPAMWEKLDQRFFLIEMGSPGAPGLGPSVTRNTGIEAAVGDIVTFCDDDDFWTATTHIATMVEVFDIDPSVDLYIANQTSVACNGTVESRDWLPDLMQRLGGRQRSQKYGYLLTFEDLVLAGGFAQLNIVAARKATVAAIGGFWTRVSYEEDRDFFWRVVDASHAVFFNPDIVAQHNVPDPNRQLNLSRSFSQTERWMISTMVSQHIAMCVDSPAIRGLCQAYEGDILRRLATHLWNEGQHALGLQYARRALAARVSLKWTLYTIGLMGRQMMRRKMA